MGNLQQSKKVLLLIGSISILIKIEQQNIKILVKFFVRYGKKIIYLNI